MQSQLIFLVFVALVKAECTGIELLVDGKPFNDDTLYKPIGSHGTFISCQHCGTDMIPGWFRDGIEISSCDNDNDHPVMICVKTKTNSSELQFTFFQQSHTGSYTCGRYGDHKMVTIDVLHPPTITIHPTSVVTTHTRSTLYCEGTGNGLIKYQWEASTVNGGPWIQISNSRRLVVRSMAQPLQYRCVVSNEAGTVKSNTATVTTLSKLILLCVANLMI